MLIEMIIIGAATTHQDHFTNIWIEPFKTIFELPTFFLHCSIGENMLVVDLESQIPKHGVRFSTIWQKPGGALGFHSGLKMQTHDFSLFQHHDGVTGTAKDAVVINYGEK